MPELPSSIHTSGGDLLFYQTEDGRTRLEVRLDADTVWLSLNQLAELFQRDKSVISRHIDNVFQEGELNAKATVAKYATVQNEAGREVNRSIEYYNLDVMISVGYRIGVRTLLRDRAFRTIWVRMNFLSMLFKNKISTFLDIAHFASYISGDLYGHHV